MVRLALVMLLAAVTVAGCGREKRKDAAEGKREVVAAAPRAVPLSDAEALGVLEAISAAGSEAARTSPDVLASPELRRFLSVVRADHDALLKELDVIGDSLQATPSPTAAADRVRAAAQNATSTTAQLGWGQADGPVVQQQINLITTFLAVLDSAVIPGTKEPLLSEYARAVRPTIAAHLQRAQQIEGLLAQSASASASASGSEAGAGTGAVRPPRPVVRDTTPPPPPDTIPRRR